MNYATDRPYDLGHPRHLDQVAIDFPELTLIGGLGGWPWVNEMVALVRRHPKLHLDTSAHRAKYLGQRGSGWEMLMQFGNTLIQDKVLVGLSAGLVSQPHETLIQEYMALPLKDAVKRSGYYGNAAGVPPGVGAEDGGRYLSFRDDGQAVLSPRTISLAFGTLGQLVGDLDGLPLQELGADAPATIPGNRRCPAPRTRLRSRS
jgi:hypothetical protein